MKRKHVKNPRTGGEGWHTAPWWLVENYMYKRLLEEGDEEVEHLWQFMTVLFDFTCVSFDFLKTSLNAFCLFFFVCHFVTLCCFFLYF